MILMLLTVASEGHAQAVPSLAKEGRTERYVLANGLEVLLRPDHRSAHVAVVVNYRTGHLSDPKGLGGLAHLAEHMAFRGSRHLTDEQTWALPQEWGATDIGAFTTPDATYFQMVVPVEQLPRALWLESERMAFTLEALNQEHLELERKIIVNEVPGVAPEIAHQLVAAGRKARLLKDHGLEEVTSTRALVYAANMINAGLDPITACQVAMVNPITDDVELAEAFMEIVQAHFPV